MHGSRQKQLAMLKSPSKHPKLPVNARKSEIFGFWDYATGKKPIFTDFGESLPFFGSFWDFSDFENYSRGSKTSFLRSVDLRGKPESSKLASFRWQTKSFGCFFTIFIHKKMKFCFRYFLSCPIYFSFWRTSERIRMSVSHSSSSI